MMNECPLDGLKQQQSCALYENLRNSGQLGSCPYQQECSGMKHDVLHAVVEKQVETRQT